MNLVRLIMLLIIGLSAGLLINWTFRGIALISICGLIVFFSALTLAPKVRNWRARLVVSIPGVVCMIFVATQLPLLFPLKTRVREEEFHDASVAKVLQCISQQRQERPLWQFEVYDEGAVTKRITMSIPAGSTLQQALDIVAESIQCDYDWHWYDTSGSVPMCAVFCLRRRENAEASPEPVFVVRGGNVWYRGDVLVQRPFAAEANDERTPHEGGRQNEKDR